MQIENSRCTNFLRDYISIFGGQYLVYHNGDTGSSSENWKERWDKEIVKGKKFYIVGSGNDGDYNDELLIEIDDIFNENLYFEPLTDPNNIENNIDIRIAINNVKSESLKLKLEKSKALPKVNAFVNQTYTGNSNEFTFTDSDQKWYRSSLLGLNVKIPIFSSLGRSANTQKAKISLDQAKTLLEETQSKIRIDANAALNEYQLAIDNYYTEKENLRLAERIEQKNKTKFFEGMIQSFELRMVQLQLYSAQSNFVSAIQKVITNKIELETLLNQSKTD